MPLLCAVSPASLRSAHGEDPDEPRGPHRAASPARTSAARCHFHRPRRSRAPAALTGACLTVFRLLRTQHDVQLDYYGKMLATCSSDRTINGVSLSCSFDLASFVAPGGDAVEGLGEFALIYYLVV